ncbi:MAG: hypothetical protein N3A58_00845 [Spirochaetes bacterium]|nr:hypothetical protein [Spirochaetota bacterium]
MSDQNRFLKDEERISLRNQKNQPKRRTIPLIILLLDIILIVLIYVFVARPALEKLENTEDKIIVEDFEIEYDLIISENYLFFDLYLKNKSIKEKIIDSSTFFIETSFSKEIIYPNFSQINIKPGEAKHILFEIPEIYSDKFYIKVFYKNRECFQTKLFNIEEEKEEANK